MSTAIQRTCIASPPSSSLALSLRDHQQMAWAEIADELTKRNLTSAQGLPWTERRIAIAARKYRNRLALTAAAAARSVTEATE